jgi:hypothetical protein
MNADGKMLVQVDGKTVVSFDRVAWRILPDVKFVGIGGSFNNVLQWTFTKTMTDFETFFGGSDASWASKS